MHGKTVKKKVFLFAVQLLCETFLITRIIQPYAILNVCRASCKVPVVIVRL